jgi:hypothetical protein
MWKIKPVLLITLLILAGIPASPPLQAAPLPGVNSVSDLWLDLSLGPPLVDWFNRVARPNDIARVDHVERIDLLDKIRIGRKLVVFKSVAEAERLIPVIADKVDIVGYNLEHGPANPADEQADPISSARRMRNLAQQYDLTLAFGPDHSFALSDGVLVAPYVDIFVLQVQRVQTEPATVRDFVLPLVPQLRQANPNLEISVQVRTEGDVVAIVDLIDSMKDDLDGVSILTSPETVEIAEALVSELRARASASPDDSAAPGKAGAEPPAVSMTSAISQVVSPTNQGGVLFWLLTLGAALIAGAIGGGVMAVLICFFKK